jgi:hypothetical protein
MCTSRIAYYRLTLRKDCAGTNGKSVILLSLSCHALGMLLYRSVVHMPSIFFSGHCRPPCLQLSISLNFVAGMASRCRQSMLGMRKSTSMTPDLGSPPRLGIMCGHLPKSASVICERYQLASVRDFVTHPYKVSSNTWPLSGKVNLLYIIFMHYSAHKKS